MVKSFHAIAVIIICSLTISCAGTKKASGPLYQNAAISNEGVDRIIIYMPSDARISSNVKETFVYINTVKTSAINYGGYHNYELIPGLHVLNVNNHERLEESIIFKIEPSKTIYIKYSYTIDQIDEFKALPELQKTKLQYATETPIRPLNLNGKSLVAQRSTFLTLIHPESNNSAYNFFNGEPGTYIVEPGLNYFIASMPYTVYSHDKITLKPTAMSYSTGDIELNIKAKSNCAYLVTQDKEKTSVRIYTKEYCNNNN